MEKGNHPEARGLRLSSILASLREHAEPAAASPPADARRPRRVRSNITLGEVVDRTSRAGFGFLAAFLALVSLPFVGLSLPFGLAIAFLGVQMILGRDRPWLPRRLRRHLVTMRTIDWIGEKLARWTGGIERFVKPRWTFLARGPFWTLVGIGLLLEGLGLALPVPIPGSNWLFAVPILIYAIGLLEADGLLILAGHVIAASQIVAAVVFSEWVLAALRKAFVWLGS